ncbi:MAG TPA: hypothetical protein VMS64_19610 [Candidatus Methylomirabilis sp.]|nr:hypothetical protein [Candidatus Methylomirabilis sp.]
MRTRADTAILISTLLCIPAIARAQANFPIGAETEVSPEQPPPMAEPPPPSQTPAPPSQPPAVAQPELPGQWIYTQQYGWIWMPYADAYTSIPPGGSGEPYAYVYYPSQGWTWVVAPWVWGIGPWPYFGAYGPARFAWYGHGWWRSPWRWHYAPVAYRGFAVHGVRPAPHVGFAPHAVVRPAVSRSRAVVHRGHR